MDENTRKRFQIPEESMRRIKKADPTPDNPDDNKFMEEHEVAKKKTE